MFRSHLAIATGSLVACASLIACSPTTPEPTTVTWYRDALPIVQERCQGCHVDGAVAGIDFTKYEIAKEYAPAIASAVQTRRMPPWMPDESCQPFRDSRHLSDEEIATLTSWVEGGALEGDVADAPPPRPPDIALDPIDVELDALEDYTPVATDHDDYRCLIVDPKLSGDKQITGFEVLPGAKELIHHVVLYKTRRTEATMLDSAADGLGYPCFGGPKTDTTITIGAWAPGSMPTEYPPGTGIALYSDEVVVMQMHYNMSLAPPRPDRTRLRLQFATRPVANAIILPLVERKFVIPPRSIGYSTSASFEVPFDVKILGMIPHMHTLGKTIKVTADDMCMIDIPRWDFNWQQFYFFSQKGGIALKGGTQLKITCSWDNPTDRSVTWGENTSDEMCLSFVYATP